MRYSQLPPVILFRQETNGKVVIINLVTGRVFVTKISEGIINLLSRLKQGPATAEELCKTSKLDQSFVERFCEELNEKVVIGGPRPALPQSPYAIRSQILDDLSAPLFIELNVTYRCNSRCRHCLVGDLRYSKETDMPFELIEKIAREAHKYNVFKLILTGGEAMVRADFFKILEVISNEDVFVALATNGLLLSKDNISEMNRYKIFKYVVSLEGATPSTHDFIRGSGSFVTTIEGLKRLNELTKAIIEIRVTCGKYNIHEIEDIVKLGRSLGAKIITFSRLKPWGWGQALANYCLSPSEITLLNSQVGELRKKYRDIIIGGDIPFRVKPEDFVCDAVYGFAVQPDGNVLPCVNFDQSVTEEVIIGNIWNQDIFAIWNSQKACMIRQHILHHTGAMHSICVAERCPVRNICAKTLAFLAFRFFSPQVEVLRKCAEAHRQIKQKNEKPLIP